MAAMNTNIKTHAFLCNTLASAAIVYALANWSYGAYWQTLAVIVPCAVAIRFSFLVYGAYIIYGSMKEGHLCDQLWLVALATFQVMVLDAVLDGHFLVPFYTLGTRREKILWFRLNAHYAMLMTVLLRNKIYITVGGRTIRSGDTTVIVKSTTGTATGTGKHTTGGGQTRPLVLMGS